MTKQEFINKWTPLQYLDLDINRTAQFIAHDELEKDLTALLEAWDADKWKKYPENMPEGDKKYYTQDKWRKNYIILGLKFSMYDTIAFRELPKPFKPE